MSSRVRNQTTQNLVHLKGKAGKLLSWKQSLHGQSTLLLARTFITCRYWILQTPFHRAERLYRMRATPDHSVSGHLSFGRDTPFFCNASPSTAISLMIYLLNSYSCLKILITQYLCCEALFYSPAPSGRVCYFWTFKFYIQLLDVIFSLNANSLEEVSLRTGFINSTWYPQYLLAIHLKQRCCFINIQLKIISYWTKDTCQNWLIAIITFYLAWQIST